MAPTEATNQKHDYKSSLFVNMFGRNVNAKEHFLSLYNAIHNTNFKIGEVEIKPVMLENVVYNNIENDVSMEINDSIVVLAEHQSTINNNMPFRCLEYLVAHYNRFFTDNDKYNTKEIKLPRPECYVFYNGEDAYPQEKIMRLSDAFKEIKQATNLKDLPESLSLDLTVKIYNINKNANHPILQKCEPLLAYSNFTEYARIGKQNGEKNPPKYALDKCRQEALLTEYFNNLSKEEQSMIFGEWDQEKFIQVQKQIAVEDNKIANAKNLIHMNLGSPEQISQAVSLPLEQVLALKDEIEKSSTVLV
ncbi:Rpn family recombination-promoting nuclease/putative transposase [uncultured Treponema sp.]|uniref:Rpn family recombination-promoting nuclease/putative transposase n=1 Tax=uncultured Treponema sp. TaxID=162155 RepID=UPI0025D9E7C6|nr:Rpn family recombination-promoting nuclease/putative transposase [uncultured Treponema sp.]